MNPQKIARATGVLFLITFITAIPAYFFYVPVLDDPRYVVGAGAETSVSLGALLELLLIIANIGTAVVLFPILKRQNEARSRLCRSPSRRMHFHRHRHRQRPRDRAVATGPRRGW